MHDHSQGGSDGGALFRAVEAVNVHKGWDADILSRQQLSFEKIKSLTPKNTQQIGFSDHIISYRLLGSMVDFRLNNVPNRHYEVT